MLQIVAKYIRCAMPYPVAGLVRDYHPADYEVEWAMIPHGIAVVVNAPAVFVGQPKATQQVI